MAILTRRPVAGLLTLAVLIGHGGCATAQRPSERAQLGTIGVVVRQFGPTQLLGLPAKGSGEGAQRGVDAATKALLSGPGGALGLILWPVGATLGAVAGAALAEDAAKVNTAQEVLLAALNGFRPGEAIRDRLLDVAWERPGPSLVALPSAIETKGADTILEITVREFHLRGNGPINPPFVLFVGVQARLLRVGSFAEIREKTFKYESPDRLFLEWAVDNAQALRDEFDRAAGRLARDLVARMLPGDLSGSIPEPPPEWARRRPEVTPPVTVAPTPPRSSHTMVVGMWSGTLHGQRGAYPLTVTFRDDGTYHATSATLNAGSFDGTWQLAGGKVVWEAVTTGRTGTATIQEANGQRTLRIVPDDGTYTVELTPTVPFDLRTWLPGNWSGSGGGYELTISSNLTWQYTSTVNGRWFASGSAHINDPGTVVLEGWFSGSPGYGPAERLTMILHRYGESLIGEFRLSRTWHVTFSRAGRPATK